MFRLQEMDLDLAADLKNTHLGRTRLGNYNRIGRNAHEWTLMIDTYNAVSCVPMDPKLSPLPIVPFLMSSLIRLKGDFEK